ncbi:MAG: serine hydrolase domain-containing protein [Candidatus Cyclobacteriaceae bacterium M3_2C_046]
MKTTTIPPYPAILKRALILYIVFYGLSEDQAVLGQSSISANIDTYLRPLVHNQDFYGVIVVTKGNSIIHMKGYGWANLEWKQKNRPESVFHLASLTKQFTATALLLAEEKGALSLEDPVNQFLPGYPRGHHIMLWHLLAQRSGIPDYNELEGYDERSLKSTTLKEVVDWFCTYPLAFEPGTKYQYSNSNYALAAYILEIATGLSYGEFLQKHIFEPLSMAQTGNYTHQDIVPFRATGYDPAPQGLAQAPYYNLSFKMGSGSIYSSASDLLKWSRALDQNNILSEASKQKLFKDYGANYGLGWGIYQQDNGGKFIAHDGKAPGYFAYVKKYLEDDITIIILSNVNSGIMNSMKGDITNIIFGREFPKYESYQILPAPTPISPYTGKYDFPPDFYFTILAQDGDLYFKWMDTPFLQYLTPIGQDRFLMRSRYDVLQFSSDTSGSFKGLEYIQRSDTTFCPKLQNP